jgi:hypothetical protein
MIVGDDCGLKGFVVFGIFEACDYGLGCQSMPDRIGARSLFALVRFGPVLRSALRRLASN